MSNEELAYIMLSLQAKGCHNINLVSPTHVVPQVLEALELAVESGLHLPLVYNSGGYDSVETLRILDGIVDIYMPDLPHGLAGTKGIVNFLSEEISRNIYVNIMDQYHPCYKAFQIPSLRRRISSAEFREALSLAQEAELSRLDKIHPIEILRIRSE